MRLNTLDQSLTRSTFILTARRVFDVLNRELFDGELPIPKISPMGKTCSYYSGLGAAFIVDIRHRTEYISIQLNYLDIKHIGSEWLYYTFEQMLHEMIHEYCYIHGINNCNIQTQYHNYSFCEAAEAHGLNCSFDNQYGFIDTFISDEAFVRIVNRVVEDNI